MLVRLVAQDENTWRVEARISGPNFQEVARTETAWLKDALFHDGAILGTLVSLHGAQIQEDAQHTLATAGVLRTWPGVKPCHREACLSESNAWEDGDTADKLGEEAFALVQGSRVYYSKKGDPGKVAGLDESLLAPQPHTSEELYGIHC